MNAALLLTALFNGAWQGTVMCAAAYLAFRCVRRLNATTMFAVWSALLGICLALPIANYAFAVRPYTVHVSASLPVTARARVSGPAEKIVYAAAAELMQPVRNPRTQEPVSISETGVSLVTRILQNAGIVIGLLALVALIRLGFLCRDIVAMMAARRAAKRIDLPFVLNESIRRPHAFASSTTLTSPCVLGFVPALIVIPEDLLDAPRSELLSVVLHEGEHVRRYDDVQNVLHRLVGALAFFAPGVRIALRELAQYREQICDDAAVSQIGDPLVYAKTLTGMAQWAQGRGVPVPSLIFKRKHLLHRLEVLLDGAVNHSLRMNRRFATGAVVAIFMAAAIVFRLQVPVIAQTVDAPRSPQAPASPAPAARVIKTVQVPVVRPKPAVRAVPATLANPAKPAKATKTAKIAPPAKPHIKIHRISNLESKIRIAEPVITAPAIAPVAFARAGGFSMATATASAMRMSLHVHVRQFATIARVAPANAILRSKPPGSDLLDALAAAGMRNLSVDQLIELRDHGVSPQLISAAQGYFGSALKAECLIRLADHGVDPTYLTMLQSTGFNGVAYEDVIRMRDHGVTADYIVKIRKFNPRASVDDIIRLRDSGF